MSLDSGYGHSEFLALLEEAVNQSGLRVALIGGVAVSFWNEPRYTDDVDFVVAADPTAIAALTTFLTGHGFRTIREQAAAAKSGPDFVQMSRVATGDSVDFQTAKTEYQDLILDRARPLPDGFGLPVASVEDLIVMKLLAMRSQDQQDLANLVNLADIDWAYVEHWAGIWQVSDKLEFFRPPVTEHKER